MKRKYEYSGIQHSQSNNFKYLSDMITHIYLFITEITQPKIESQKTRKYYISPQQCQIVL